MPHVGLLPYSPLQQTLAAVHRENFAGDEIAFYQIDGCSGNILGNAKPAQWNTFHRARALVWRGPVR